MARLALLARFHRKADLCKAGWVGVSRRPFLEMPGNLTGLRQYFEIKILGREKQPGNLSIPFCFIVEPLKHLKPSWRKAEQLYGPVKLLGPRETGYRSEKTARP